MIRNSIEELVYELFKNNSSYASSSSAGTASLDSNQPNCSRAFQDAEMKPNEDQQDDDRKLTIGDIHKLFQKL